MKKLWLILLAACLLGCVPAQPETEPFPPKMQIQRHVPGQGSTMLTLERTQAGWRVCRTQYDEQSRLCRSRWTVTRRSDPAGLLSGW